MGNASNANWDGQLAFLFDFIGKYWVAIIALTGLFLLVIGARQRNMLWKSIRHAIRDGLRLTSGTAFMLALLGVLSAVLTMTGTIEVLSKCLISLIGGFVALPMAFVVCAVLSMVLGSSMATVTAVGLACMTACVVSGIPAWVAGGAILSGIYVGDRCSPMSSSLLLLSRLTGTDHIEDSKRLIKSTLLPFALSVVAYAAIGYALNPTNGLILPLRNIPLTTDDLIPIIPLAVMAVMLVRRMDIRITFATTILVGMAICLATGTTGEELASAVVSGANMGVVNAGEKAGGLASVSDGIIIVLATSPYAKLLEGFDIAKKVKRRIAALRKDRGRFVTTLVTATGAAALTCNQTLSIALTEELVGGKAGDRRRVDEIADTAVVVPAVIPWAVACSVPLSVIEAPTTSILTAFFIFLVPLCHYVGGKAKAGGAKDHAKGSAKSAAKSGTQRRH